MLSLRVLDRRRTAQRRLYGRKLFLFTDA